ncbi:MAG: phasin family protein [Rhodocyclaceae bacterium]
MTKFTAPEQFVEAGKAALETLLGQATSAFGRAERLAALNLNTARSVLEDGVANTKAVLAVKEPQELVKLQASLAQPMVDKAVAYARSVYEIVAEGQAELTKLVEAQIAEINKTVNSALDQAAKSAPAGSEAAFTAAKSAMAAANSAYDSVSKAAKQASDMAEANVAAATKATVKALSSKKAA